MQKIAEILDEVLATEETAKQAKRTSSLHKWSPSMFGRCYRAQWWNKSKEPLSDPPTAELLRRFQCGKLFHNFIQDLLKKSGMKIEAEVKVENEDVLGYADLIINGEEVGEIKSQHSRAFWWLEKSDKEIEKEKYENLLQLMTYAFILGLHKTRLILVSKDDLFISEYQRKLDDYWRAEVGKEIRILKTLTTLPPAIPRAYLDKKTGGSNECKYCFWQTKCNQ